MKLKIAIHIFRSFAGVMLACFPVMLCAQSVDMGYYTQDRDHISGAVATVSGHELERTPTANLSQTFEGLLPGVITRLNNAELSKTSVSTFVRGLNTTSGASTVYVVDGIVQQGNTFEYITPQEVESVTVLKDASSLAIYGIQGAGGVIVITTRRGLNDGLRVSASFDQSFQQMTRTPLILDSWEYASLRNQAAANDGVKPLFTQTQIDGYKAGENRLFYPNTDYYNLMMKPLANMQRATVSISGGNDRVRTFSSISMMNQGTQFITDDSSFPTAQTHYNPTPHNLWFIYRSNLDVTFNRFFSGYIRLNGSVRRERTAGDSNAAIYGALLHIPPTVYGPYAPLYEDPEDAAKMIGGQIMATDREMSPAYGRLNRSGYTTSTLSHATTQVGVRLDLGPVVEGLTIEGMFSYRMNARGHLRTSSDYERGTMNNYYQFETVGTATNMPLEYSKSSTLDYYLLGRGQIDYKRRFGKHSIQAMGFAYAQSFVPESTSGLEYFDYNRVNLGVMVAYSYGDRYLLKADLGYSGSEQFAPGRQFTATPSVSVGWNVSNENFMSRAGWLSCLKLRASYGVTANDQLGGGRFQYSDNIKKEGASYMPSIPAAISEYRRGNPLLAAQKVKMTNVGVDIGLFDELSLSVDWFDERSDNMLVGSDENSGSLSYLGIPLDYLPLRNVGRIRNSGIDLNLSYVRNFGKDWTLSVGGNFVYARNRIVDVGEAAKQGDYAYSHRLEGYPVGQSWGYLVDRSDGGNGYFNSQAEVDALPYSIGSVRVGDLKYRDLNEDGRIDEKDLAPIGWGAVPQIGYGFSLGLTYRNLEFSCLFQGTGRIRYYYGLEEFRYDGIFSDLHRTAWTAERAAAGDAITYPALSLSSTTSAVGNDFFIGDASYLRLKNVQLNWRLPGRWVRAITADEIRLTFAGHNLVTWDNMRTKNIDPELNSIEQFQNYRVYNIGIRIVF